MADIYNIRAVTKFPSGHIYVGGGRYPSGVIFRKISSHESTLALRDCSPIPLYPRLPTLCPSPPPSSSSLHCNHGNNHSSLSLAPLQSDCALSILLTFSFALLLLPSHGQSLRRVQYFSFSTLPLPPLFLVYLYDRLSLSLFLHKHSGFRCVSFYR